MLDKLDCRIPAETAVTQKFSALIHQDRHRFSPIFKSDRYYTCKADLRPLGFDAYVHLDLRHGGGSKIEFIDTAEHMYDEWLGQISAIWEFDPEQAQIMRLDVAVDVPGIPVSWFREHARFKHKRLASRIDKTDDEADDAFVGFSSADSQTIYAGKRPNIVRIYDKVPQLRREWRKECRQIDKFNEGLAVFESSDEVQALRRTRRTFSQYCEAKCVPVIPGSLLTRVERQFGGGRIPREITTLKDLPHIREFDPFSTLEIFASDRDSTTQRPAPPGEPGNAGVSMRDHLAGIGFQTVCKEFGSVQSAVSYVTRYGRGNGKRVLGAIHAYMPTSELRVTTEEIKAEFRKSVQRHFKQIDPMGIDICIGAEHNSGPYEITGKHSGILPKTGEDRRGETAAGSIA